MVAASTLGLFRHLRTPLVFEYISRSLLPYKQVSFDAYTYLSSSETAMAFARNPALASRSSSNFSLTVARYLAAAAASSPTAGPPTNLLPYPQPCVHCQTGPRPLGTQGLVHPEKSLHETILPSVGQKHHVPGLEHVQLGHRRR
jgi:hypothetical protein